MEVCHLQTWNSACTLHRSWFFQSIFLIIFHSKYTIVQINFYIPYDTSAVVQFVEEPFYLRLQNQKTREMLAVKWLLDPWHTKIKSPIKKRTTKPVLISIWQMTVRPTRYIYIWHLCLTKHICILIKKKSKSNTQSNGAVLLYGSLLSINLKLSLRRFF